MLDRLLGGSGISPGKIAALTEIETTVMERMFGRALESLQEAWKTIMDIHPRMEAMETNPQFMQIVSPNETIALISLSAKIGETSGMINLCIPHVVIEPVMPKLSVHHWFVSQKKTRAPEEVEALETRVQSVKLPIVAELGSSTITIQEFLQLSAGDVIKLQKPMDEPLEIRVGDRRKYRGTPGTAKGKLAVQITEMISEGAEELDE